MSQNSEHDWVERAKRGEPTAIAELYRRYWRAARATAYGVIGDFSLAEDAAAEAFCAVLEGLPALREAERFGPWLRTIVIRTARRLQAARTRQKIAQSPALSESSTAAPSARAEQQELVVLVRGAVAKLPQTLREAICLFHFEGYSIDEAARFLGIPAGTLKRRLHDGRRRLYLAAQHILKGTKPVDQEQERILRQLREAADRGPDSEDFYQLMREALHLRPVPHDLLRQILQRYRGARGSAQAPLPPEKERSLREMLARIYSPSERATDENHPVGAAARAIRAELPEFQSWQIDFSQIDFSRIRQQMSDDPERAFSCLSPPEFTRESAGAYLSASRAALIEDEDGSVRTMFELMQRKTTREAFHTRMKQGTHLSDALWLLWKQAEPLELRAVEERLRRLAKAVAPGVSVSFRPYEEPRYRAGLRMQLGDNPIPAAIGGVLEPWPGVPDQVQAGTLLIYLEPWAAARSGQTIDFADSIPVPPWFG